MRWCTQGISLCKPVLATIHVSIIILFLVDYIALEGLGTKNMLFLLINPKMRKKLVKVNIKMSHTIISSKETTYTILPAICLALYKCYSIYDFHSTHERVIITN